MVIEVVLPLAVCMCVRAEYWVCGRDNGQTIPSDCGDLARLRGGKNPSEVSMNCAKAVYEYCQKMVQSISGMKVLLLDAETAGIISMVYSQTEILEQEVFLVERIDMPHRDKMTHLKAIVFVRPTQENFSLLQAELKDPKYSSYYLYFSNIIGDRKQLRGLELLAESDENEVVHEVHEFYADYYALSNESFSLQCPSTMGIIYPRSDPVVFDRVVDGILSCLLALKKRPDIRFTSKSVLSQRLAEAVKDSIDSESALFTFGGSDSTPVLVILDRKDDPVTPLLNQWTYQAMVHEVLNIENNRVKLDTAGGKQEEFVLSAHQDPFFKKYMYKNFGDLGIAVRELVEELQSKTASHSSMDTIEDMKRFMEAYPEFKKFSSATTKHVMIVDALSARVGADDLMRVSEVEQEITQMEASDKHFKAITALIGSPSINDKDKIRLVCLFALRYESKEAEKISALIEQLKLQDISNEDCLIVMALLDFAGVATRTPGLFGNQGKIASSMANIRRGLKNIENVYTQHEPLIFQIVKQLASGTLKPDAYPFILRRGPQSKNEKVQEIIFFMVGGITYEEVRTVALLNSPQSPIPGVRVVLGGNTVHNSDSFLRDLGMNMNPNDLLARLKTRNFGRK